jgi:uncharacterized protein YndB with AHSA1/START domain
MSEAAGSLVPLRKTVVVPVEPSRAFELFTAGVGNWWPLATHSVGLDDAVLVSFPGEVGGSIIETMRDGRTSVWGTVTAWDPPAGISFTWHPGQPESWAGDIDLRFTPDGSGGTIVELTHSGWNRRSDGAAARRGYDSGWDIVLVAYRLVGQDKAAPA